MDFWGGRRACAPCSPQSETATVACAVTAHLHKEAELTPGDAGTCMHVPYIAEGTAQLLAGTVPESVTFARLPQAAQLGVIICMLPICTVSDSESQMFENDRNRRLAGPRAPCWRDTGLRDL